MQVGMISNSISNPTFLMGEKGYEWRSWLSLSDDQPLIRHSQIPLGAHLTSTKFIPKYEKITRILKILCLDQ